MRVQQLIKSLSVAVIGVGFVGCAGIGPTQISEPTKGTHIIGMKTGKYGKEWKVHKDMFDKKATSLCGGESYKIIEKASRPKALEVAGDLVEKYHYYWVVECFAKK